MIRKIGSQDFSLKKKSNLFLPKRSIIIFVYDNVNCCAMLSCIKDKFMFHVNYSYTYISINKNYIEINL